MKPAQLLGSPDDLSNNDDAMMLHIELQATDSNGSSSTTTEEEYYSYSTVEQGGGDSKYDALATQEDATTTASPTATKTLIRRRRRPPVKSDAATPLLSLRKGMALLFGIIPVCLLAFERIPEHCHFFCDMEAGIFFYAAAFFGGFGAVFYGDNVNHLPARLVGGAVSGIGSLFTVSLVLQSIHSQLAFLSMFVGLFGAMPGVVVYVLLRILMDECAKLNSSDDEDEDFAPLTTSLSVF